MDPLVGLVGTTVISSWAWGLLLAAGRVLVDAFPEARRIEGTVRERFERDGDRVTDFHVWQIGPGNLACIVDLVSDTPCSAPAYKASPTDISGLSHVTIEVETCPAPHPHLRRVA
jgi:Co/Zn/Cd efflux system component